MTQVPTRYASNLWVMSSSAFALGVRDARAGLPHRATYDQWDTDGQWNYERGRAWALLAPLDIPLKRNGAINPDAITYFDDDII